MGGTQRLLGLVEGLDGQALAGEHAAEAGLPSATGLRLDLHPHLDIGPLPVMSSQQETEMRIIQELFASPNRRMYFKNEYSF